MTTSSMLTQQIAGAGDRATRRRSALVDIQSASQRTAAGPVRSQDFRMTVAASRPAPVQLPSIENAAADIRRLTAALKTRREVAPDNLLELAALAVDLKRASMVWRQLVPTGVWA